MCVEKVPVENERCCLGGYGRRDGLVMKKKTRNQVDRMCFLPRSPPISFVFLSERGLVSAQGSVSPGFWFFGTG